MLIVAFQVVDFTPSGGAFGKFFRVRVSVWVGVIKQAILLCKLPKTTNFFFFMLFPHDYVVSMYDDKCLHVARSYMSSSDSPFYLISSLGLTLSNHLLLGLQDYLPSPLYFQFHHRSKHVLINMHFISEPITVQLDLKVTIDDVPIGLSLQHYSPFKFSCSKLWMKHIPDVTLSPDNLHRVIHLSVRYLSLPNTGLKICVIFVANAPMFSHLLPGLSCGSKHSLLA